MISSLFFYIASNLFFSNIAWPVLNLTDHGQVIKRWETESFSQDLVKMDELELSAHSTAVLDLNSDFFVFERNSDEVLPIASISKLMSALVFVDIEIDLDDYYKIRQSDRRLGGKDYLFLGEEVRNMDLLALSLIASDNTAVIALISSIGINEKEFVARMNDKAKEMGLYKTYFDDPTGLSYKNVSTAREVALMSKEALGRKEILDLLRLYEYRFETKNGRKKEIVSTNELLLGLKDVDIKGDVIAGKTGYNDSAGYCLSLNFSLEREQEFISVVLDSSSIKNRFLDTERVVERVYSIYK